jgi:hypothetical protein
MYAHQMLLQRRTLNTQNRLSMKSARHVDSLTETASQSFRSFAASSKALKGLLEHGAQLSNDRNYAKLNV